MAWLRLEPNSQRLLKTWLPGCGLPLVAKMSIVPKETRSRLMMLNPADGTIKMAVRPYQQTSIQTRVVVEQAMTETSRSILVNPSKAPAPTEWERVEVLQQVILKVLGTKWYEPKATSSKVHRY